MQNYEIAVRQCKIKQKEIVMSHFEEIQTMLSEELAVRPEKIQLDTELKDLGADSIVLMTIADNIQEKYGIEVTTEAVKNVRTVKDIVDYLDANV